MPVPSHDLSRLDPHSFEHMVNFIALRVLGSGASGFGPGPDGGRDGYFEGKAPYPSTSTQWQGKWYIQSKFMRQHPGANPQQWLITQIKEELAEFTKPHSNRKWPDIWIVATNIEPSGVPQTGAFDQIRSLVKAARPQLAKKFQIWGGRKILNFLSLHSAIADHYAEFLTSGELIAQLYHALSDLRAQPQEIMRYLVVSQLTEQQFTRLEQAGSATDGRPGIHDLFTDIPYRAVTGGNIGMAAADLGKAAAENHRPTPIREDNTWKQWRLEPVRARVWFVKGGPGQGKSTLSQYISQIQRAAFILNAGDMIVNSRQRSVAKEIRNRALADNLWPASPRIPLTVELKEYAQWYGAQEKDASRRLMGYIAVHMTKALGEEVAIGTLKRAFKTGRWMFIFDGLDEVPGDVKERVSSEVDYFINDQLLGMQSDALTICTSRPQGYSGQWDGLEAAAVDLTPLNPTQALACAIPVLRADRAEEEANKYIAILKEAIGSAAVIELMTSPLQAHIMAVVVRDGGRPPERRWQLFINFYNTIRKREANKNLGDKRLAGLLREEEQLIKYLHNRVGFELHAKAETSAGAITSMNREELRRIVKEVVTQLKERGIEETVDLVMEATTERLVLVNTPDEGNEVRFDIRPLQEFFAAEYIYEGDHYHRLDDRIRCICVDSHWREVSHFLLSALLEGNRMIELRRAISVIEQIDNGDGDQLARSLQRRLAIGGILASRLLQEGVLEQDKRLRAMLRSCLLPLLGCSIAQDHLGNVRSLQSRAWLADVVCDAIFELSEEESIGAISVAAILLEDLHPRTHLVRARFDEASTELRGAVMRVVCAGAVPDEGWRNLSPRSSELQPWFVRSMLHALMRPDWKTLGAECIGESLRALRMTGTKHLITSNDIDFSEIICETLAQEFEDVDESGNPAKPLRDQASEDFGGFKIIFFGPADKTSIRRWAEVKVQKSFAGKGYFGLLCKVACFIRSGVKADYDAMMAYVDGRVEFFRTLPLSLSTFLSDQLCGENQEPVVCGYADALRTERPGFLRHVMFLPSAEKGGLNCASFARRFPTLGLDLIVGEYGPERIGDCIRRYVCSEEGTAWLSDALELGQIDPFKHVGSWKEFFELERVGPIFREFVIRRARQREVCNTYSPLRSVFYLQLPEEVSLLPHLVRSIDLAVQSRALTDSRVIDLSHGKKFKALVKEFGVSSDDALRCQADNSLTKSERAGAFIFEAANHDAIDHDVHDYYIRRIYGLYERENGSWFPPAIATVLSDAVFDNNKNAIAVIGLLIELTRRDYAARLALDIVFADWREMARAPVQKSFNSIWC